MFRWFTLPLALCIATVIQAQTPDTVIAGPYGVPQAVLNEGNGWDTPIEVYSDATKVVYVPDITKPGWAQWHIQMFKEQHMYFTYVYTYLRKERATVRDTVYVNMQTGHIVVVRFLKSPLQFDLKTASPMIVKTVTSITKVVEDSIAHFNGPDAQTAAQQQRGALGRAFMCDNPMLPPSPDCSLSDADFQAKHPVAAPPH